MSDNGAVDQTIIRDATTDNYIVIGNTAAKQLLAACIGRPRLLDHCDGLTAKHFPGHWAVVWEALLAADAEGAVDMRAVLDRLPGHFMPQREMFARDLLQADTTPTDEHVQLYVQRVLNAYRRQRAVMVGDRLAQAGRSDGADIERAEQDAIDALLQGGEGGNGFAWFDEIGATVLEELEHNVANPAEIRGLQCGLVDLDMAVGGFDPDSFVIVGARPSMGKSALVFEMVKNFAIAGHPGLMITSETSREMVIKRMACSDVGVNYQREFKRGKLLPRNEYRQRIGESRVSTWEVLHASIGRLRKLPILHIPANRGPKSIHSLVHRMKRAHGLEWLLIDTLNLLPGDQDTRGGEYQSMTDKSSQIARIPHELGILTVATWQLSRAVEGSSTKIPQVDHLRDSGAGEQDGDIILQLYRAEYYKSRGVTPHATELHGRTIEDNHMVVLVQKNRDGATGRAPFLHFDLEYARVGNAALEGE